ncbi:hypothetical protein L6452_02933 [Arctium lappa]|uniref:Uncharacterized protein n=1 Tax=Arctium lappa TaxID=4217 RepID=A0ACB9FKU4_ARCLA|nr:hypothetical protein L6452_02933 [Arctium lappa]
MLRRKPSKIEVKIEDKEELEEARKRAAVTATSTTTQPTGGASLLHHFNQSSTTTSSKSHPKELLEVFLKENGAACSIIHGFKICNLRIIKSTLVTRIKRDGAMKQCNGNWEGARSAFE